LILNLFPSVIQCVLQFRFLSYGYLDHWVFECKEELNLTTPQEATLMVF